MKPQRFKSELVETENEEIGYYCWFLKDLKWKNYAADNFFGGVLMVIVNGADHE